MQYEIIFYSGLAGAGITLIITIIAFFKCNVVENIKDLLGGKFNTFKSKSINNVVKAESKKIKTKKVKESENLSYRESEDLTKDSEKNKELDKDNVLDKSQNDTLTRNDENAKTTNVLGNKGSKMYGYENVEDDDATGILDDDNEATCILDDDNATEILDEDDVTGILYEDDEGFSDEFISELDIVIVHRELKIH